MTEKNKILNYLGGDYIKNAPFIENLTHDDCEIVYGEDDGVLLRKQNGFYMLTVSDVSAAEKALSLAPEMKLCFVTDGDSAKLVCDKYRFSIKKPCYQAVYDKTQRIFTDLPFDIKKLTPSEENINFVFSHYTLSFSKDHIAYLLQNVGVYGAYYGDELVGFIGKHEERSLGLLEVVPARRREGAGYALEAFMINKTLDEGCIPYAHIIAGNDKSLALQKKLGFSIYDKTVFWCEND